ncbi:hypothetical protein RGU44_22735 [Pseudomonas sp. 5C2]|uniref:hypothetical protein n=1 Tax=Pseudomonas sp. 5C2 TaxID=3048588 RepID=UPI002AB3308E|nr:hypothetical protein [Pseudomonas sp. 5C2]MDY7567846.1 hypothetical protein [Pseudomonas sp. 5C2]MEB0242118.1 hypothetical protein [Pseudomonas sp. 5C2]
MNDYVEPTMSVEACRAYIMGCEFPAVALSSDEVDHPVQGKMLRSLTVDEKKEGAAVVANSIVSFVAGMSKQNKDDIKNSVLFATLVANREHPEMEGQRWYEKFMEVMSRASGWLPKRKDYARYTTVEQQFTMDQVGLKILSSAVAAAALPGPTSVLLLGVAKQALDALQASKEPLRLFEGKSRSHAGGTFSIVSCTESSDGEVVMAVGTVSFSSTLDVTNVLFWNWNNTSVSISRAESHLVLNQGVYANVRDDILAKLGSNAKDAVAEYSI